MPTKPWNLFETQRTQCQQQDLSLKNEHLPCSWPLCRPYKHPPSKKRVTFFLEKVIKLGRVQTLPSRPNQRSGLGLEGEKVNPFRDVWWKVKCNDLHTFVKKPKILIYIFSLRFLFGLLFFTRLFFFIISWFFFHIKNFSGRFDTSRSMIARSVPEIHCTRGFCDKEEE